MIIPDAYRPHLHEDLEARFRTILYEDWYVAYYASRAGYEEINVRVVTEPTIYTNEEGILALAPGGAIVRSEWRPIQKPR
jgi:hypothetical protein